MDWKKLTNLAYNYYPKGVSSFDNKEYEGTLENGLLIDRLNNSTFFVESELIAFKAKIESEFTLKLEDVTVKSWHDRCFNLQALVEERNNNKKILCINLSKLIPSYFCYILEVEFDNEIGRLKYLPRREKNYEKKIDNEISKINLILESSFNESGLFKFPENMLNEVIPDISFQDIDFGKFTMFNAFFLNNFTTRFA